MSTNLAQAINLLIDPAINKWLGKHGYVRGTGPGGLLQQLTNTTNQEALGIAMQRAAEADRPGIERLLHGLSTLAGVTWTPELAAKARTLSGDFAKIAPVNDGAT